MIYKVLSILDIGIPEGKNNFNINCPVCGEKRNEKKLNINLSKGVFHCAKCNAGGGPAALYGFMKYQIDPSVAKTTEVRQQLIKEINGQAQASNYQPSAQKIEVHRIDVDPAEISCRNDTYSELLNMLELTEFHKKDLIRRGLPEDIIIKNGYKSVPMSGISKIPSMLLKEGKSLLGVPGFYQNNNDKWTIQKNASGYFVPVRNINGEIEGMQIRADNPYEGRKYYWLSSTDKKMGCGAKTWSHFVGYPEDSVYLTEGPLKADIINYFLDVPVIAIPGVNALSNLEIMLDELKKMDVSTIVTCFDMDFLSNQNVKEAYARLTSLIRQKGFNCKKKKWDPEYKGLDDYLLAMSQNK